MRSIRKRRKGLSAFALALALATTGCRAELSAPEPTAHTDEATPRRGGTLELASFADVRALDPANLTDGLAPQMLEAIFAGLVDYDTEGHIAPDLAERWEITEGGKVYRFFLREGARFHDGEEVTAADVKRSAERALHPSAPNPYSSYFESVIGYREFVAKKAEHLEGIQVEGRQVVAFRLERPDAIFLSVLALSVLRPVCKSAGERYADSWHPCGAGPFKLPPGGWDHGRQLALVRHEGYFRPGIPYLDGVRWTFQMNATTQRFKLMMGDLDATRDLTAPDMLRFQADPRWSPFGGLEAEKQIYGEVMNTEVPPFDNVEIRRAVAAALDREQLRLVRATNFRVSNQPVPPSVFGYDASLPGQRYDYPAALEHMRRAGYPYDPVTRTGGYPHKIPYLVYRQGNAEYTAQVVAQQLDKIGLRLDLRVVNYPTYVAMMARRRQSSMAFGGAAQDFPDALSFFEPLFHSKSIQDEDSNNLAFYKNPRVDELIDRARREVDPAARQKLYSETSRILCDEAPWAFTFGYRFYVQRQSYVRDLRSHVIASYDLRGTWLDRAAGPAAARAIFSRDTLAALFGDAPARTRAPGGSPRGLGTRGAAP